MIAVISRAGVTSKAGLRTATPSGASWTPPMWVTSAGGALLDGDGAAVGQGKVDGRGRRGDVEGESVLPGQHRHRVGADLVGGVAVGGDAVGADDDAVDLALAHQVAGHVVADQRHRDAVALQLPGGQPRPLQPGAGLVGEDRDLLAGLDRGADHAEGGAVAGGGQGPGVAVGEDAGTVRDQLLRRGRPAPGCGARPRRRSPAPRPAGAA